MEIPLFHVFLESTELNTESIPWSIYTLDQLISHKLKHGIKDINQKNKWKENILRENR